MTTGELIWVVVRASGLAALLAATLSIVLGTLATAAPAPGVRRSAADLDRRILRQYAHRSAGVVALTAIAVHAVLVVVDSFVNVSVVGLLVPFTAGYERWALGIGTLAAYGFLGVAVTGMLRGRMATSTLGRRVWRGVHLASYVVWGAAFAHGLMAGTDGGQWWAWLLYGVSLLSVAGALVIRGLGLDAHDRSPLPAARRAVRTGAAL